MSAGAWPNTIAPPLTNRFRFEGALETVSDASIIGIAARVGVLLEEEKQYPDLVRTRLKRNILEKP